MKINLQLKHCLLVLIVSGLQTTLWAQDDTSQPIDTFSRDSLYNYWIKFPADTQTTCLGQINVPGLEFAELGCDLLAIGSSDDFFSAAQDSSCYKILRTYRIINWCEYNGQAAPVVVGRDWDDWNGTNPGRCNRDPDGNNRPGDSDFYVHVKRDFNDNLPDTVWYDADADPHNNIPDYPLTEDIEEGYWWRVISGSANKNTEDYYEGNCSTWAYDDDASDSDIAGNIAQDDSDDRYGSFGYWLYTQHISVYDDAAPVIEVGGPDAFFTESATDCGASVVIPLVISDSCSDNQPTIELIIDIGNDGATDGEVTILWNGSDYSSNLSIGDYRLIIKAFDDCGNSTEVEKIFSVLDGVGPAPICHDNLIAEINESEIDTMPPMATIWASDLIASNIFDCSGQSDSLRQNRSNLVTDFSINRVGDPVDQSQKGLNFFCGDQSPIGVPVEIHAWDEAGNHDFCTTEIFIQDNINTCSAPVEVSGIIQTPNGTAVPNVDIRVSGGINYIDQTDDKGQYNIRLLRSTGDVFIEPNIETDPSIGISTADLIRIQRHIVGSQPFDSPYQLLASDLDNNGRVNFMDLIRIRKTILGIEEPTAYDKYWLFIATDYQFQEPMSPWNETFPETRTVDGSMNFNEYQANFLAIKIGDANESAVNQIETRSQQKAQLSLPNLKLSAGQTYQVPIHLKNGQQFEGCQFALTWDTETIEVLSADTPSDQAAIHLDTKSGNHLKASWINVASSSSDNQIGSIQIRAKRNTNLNEVLVIGDRYLAPEAYNSAFSIRPLELNFQSIEMDWSITQNPFQVSSTLQFSEQVSGPLRVYDRSGRMVWQTILNQAKAVEIRKSDLGAAGNYFFNVTHQGKLMSGQLIAID
ncbi:MAG: hypothetical protein Sapg2KO_21800 [Saprospiraceae bacterium]